MSLHLHVGCLELSDFCSIANKCRHICASKCQCLRQVRWRQQLGSTKLQRWELFLQEVVDRNNVGCKCLRNSCNRDTNLKCPGCKDIRASDSHCRMKKTRKSASRVDNARLRSPGQEDLSTNNVTTGSRGRLPVAGVDVASAWIPATATCAATPPGRAAPPGAAAAPPGPVNPSAVAAFVTAVQRSDFTAMTTSSSICSAFSRS